MNADLLARIKKMLTALAYFDKHWATPDEGVVVPTCRLCGHAGNHAPDCALAALLSEIRAEMQPLPQPPEVKP